MHKTPDKSTHNHKSAKESSSEERTVFSIEGLVATFFVIIMITGVVFSKQENPNYFLRNHFENIADIPVYSYAAGLLGKFFAQCAARKSKTCEKKITKIFNFQNRVAAVTTTGLLYEVATMYLRHGNFDFRNYDYIDAGIYLAMGIAYGYGGKKINNYVLGDVNEDARRHEASKRLDKH